MKTKSSLLVALTIITTLTSVNTMGAKEPVLKRGAKAPDFTVANEEGNLVKLSDFLGSKVALCFYPKNNTSNCTKQMCNLRNSFAELEKENIVVLGMNYASPKDNQAFKAKHALPFSILSDENKFVAKAYGAYGGILRYFVPKRKTFLIDENGIVVRVIDSVNITQHAQQIIETFRK